MSAFVSSGERGERLKHMLRQLADVSEAMERQRKGHPEVFLNVYDMLSINNYVFPLGLGAFHSGVEVYGKEYAYGCHPFSYTGIFDMEPRQVDELPGQEVCFREAIQLGHTHLSEKEVRELIVAMGREYNGCDYNILHRNCNHFTSDLCRRLCGATPPHWVNRLAYLGSWMPFVLHCLPPQLLSQSSPPQPHTPTQSNTAVTPTDMESGPDT